MTENTPAALRYERWTHRRDVAGLISQAVTTALGHPPHDLAITIRRPTAEDGCWCLRNFERPHPHDPGLGKCPPKIAHDNYVRLTIERPDAE